MKKTCIDCQYFKPNSDFKGAVNGQCRINPPDTTRTAFPMVKNSWWRGKFREKNKSGGFW